MRLLRQLQALLIFLRKDLKRKKEPKLKTNDFHPLRSFCVRKKNVVFVV